MVNKMARALILLLLWPEISMAMPPEGLEAFAIIKGRSDESQFYAWLHHKKPLWIHEDTSLWLMGNTKTEGSNLISYGFRASISPEAGDRLAYYGRFI